MWLQVDEAAVSCSAWRQKRRGLPADADRHPVGAGKRSVHRDIECDALFRNGERYTLLTFAAVDDDRGRLHIPAGANPLELTLVHRASALDEWFAIDTLDDPQLERFEITAKTALDIGRVDEDALVERGDVQLCITPLRHDDGRERRAGRSLSRICDRWRRQGEEQQRECAHCGPPDGTSGDATGASFTACGGTLTSIALTSTRTKSETVSK